MDNTEIFADTLSRCGRGILKLKTAYTVKNTKIYAPGYVSGRVPKGRSGIRSIKTCGTLEAARQIHKYGRTAVLSFANPIEPGGGVVRGANAQEEYICRATNLYPSLKSRAAEPFYKLHREKYDDEFKNGAFSATDTLIYSPGVTVFRDETGRYVKRHFRTDIITCAAPMFLYGVYGVDVEELYGIFCRRIKNIFEAALDNGAVNIVLGAFGCGAFNNPPETVAKAFKDVLSEQRYKNAFENVVFAIKGGGANSAIFSEVLDLPIDNRR